jgi:hypothetical protein
VIDNNSKDVAQATAITDAVKVGCDDGDHNNDDNDGDDDNDDDNDDNNSKDVAQATAITTAVKVHVCIYIYVYRPFESFIDGRVKYACALLIKLSD